MSIWTCKPSAVVANVRLSVVTISLAALLSVAGCAEVPNAAAGSDTARSNSESATPGLFSRLRRDPFKSGAVLRQGPMAGGDVIVAGPEGYCIDGKSFTDKASGGFAILASCVGLTDGRVGGFVDPAIMTVTVLPRQLRTEQPDAAALATGNAQVLERLDGDGVSLVHLATGGTALSENSDPKYWRGAMVINGHLVGLAVYTPKDSVLAGAQGRVLVMALAEQMRTQSPYVDHTPDDVAVGDAENTEQPTKKPLKNLFTRLFQ